MPLVVLSTIRLFEYVPPRNGLPNAVDVSDEWPAMPAALLCIWLRVTTGDAIALEANPPAGEYRARMLMPKPALLKISLPEIVGSLIALDDELLEKRSAGHEDAGPCVVSQSIVANNNVISRNLRDSSSRDQDPMIHVVMHI